MTGSGGLWRLAAAALAGAAGLGAEALALEAAGLSAGFVRASALGLGAFVAGWALGAHVAGRSRGPAARRLFQAGLAAALAAALVPSLFLHLGADPPGEAAAVAAAVLLLAAAGFPQGAFLPFLARSQASVAGLFAANLAGSMAGAWLIAHVSVARGGIRGAALVAAAAALAAGIIGAASARGGAHCPVLARPAASAPRGARAPLRWALIGAVTAWTIGAEWVLLRLAVLWTGGHRAALAALLAASLLALAAGAALLPPVLPRDARGVALALALAALGTLWPHAVTPGLAALDERGAGPAWLALALVLPPLAPLGAVVPLLFRALAPAGGLPAPAGELGAADGGRRLGGLLVHEAWAAPLAAPLAHWVLVPSLGLGGALGAFALLAVPAGLALRGAAGALGPALGALGVAVAVLAARLPEPALAASALSDPALCVRSFAVDAEFTVTVADDGLLGERTLLTDTFRAAGTGRDYLYMRALGHLPLLLHPRPERVAVVALGTGTTLGAVALHAEPRAIDVLEISPAVVAAARWFEDQNRGALADARVRVITGDARRSLASRPGAYDVVTMEPLLPDAPLGVHLYTEEFYAVARRALAPGGLLCQWVPPHALEPPVFDAVLDAFARSWPWSGAWVCASQVVLVGGEREPALDPLRFAGATSGELALGLHELGLGTPAGVAARFVAPGADLLADGRRLSDRDPWIAYRAKPAGAAVLGWLPANLGRLTALRLRASPLPLPDAAAERAAQDLLLAARVALAETERDLARGALAPAEARARADAALERARAGGDREAAELERQAAFLWGLRAGVAALQAGDAPAAIEGLLAAAELRGERADVHLYLAAALAELGIADAAERARLAALERCPRVAETSAGRRVRALGFDPARPVAAASPQRPQGSQRAQQP